MSITMDDVRKVVAVLHSSDRARLAYSLQDMINEYIGQEAKIEDLRARLNRHGAANNDARAELHKAEDKKVLLHQVTQDLAQTILAKSQHIDRLKTDLKQVTTTGESQERTINRLTGTLKNKEHILYAQRREIKELQVRLRPNWVPYTGTDQPYAITFELSSRYFQTHPTSNGMMQDKCQEVLSRAFDMTKSFSSCLMQDNPEGFQIRCRPDQFAMFIYYRHKLGNCINGIRDLDPALDKLPGDIRLVDVTDRCIQTF